MFQAKAISLSRSAPRPPQSGRSVATCRSIVRAFGRKRQPFITIRGFASLILSISHAADLRQDPHREDHYPRRPVDGSSTNSWTIFCNSTHGASAPTTSRSRIVQDDVVAAACMATLRRFPCGFTGVCRRFWVHYTVVDDVMSACIARLSDIRGVLELISLAHLLRTCSSHRRYSTIVSYPRSHHRVASSQDSTGRLRFGRIGFICIFLSQDI
ncbi:hypothetical protein C8R45DRAFT_465371 [Mycena sanguinolenta]|nr:hypothetical protein C8R45DRAFT_465371 [Mycena sanguinolenta]